MHILYLPVVEQGVRSVTAISVWSFVWLCVPDGGEMEKWRRDGERGREKERARKRGERR